MSLDSDLGHSHVVLSELLDTVENPAISYLRLEFCSVAGQSLSKIVPLRHAEDVFKNYVEIYGGAHWLTVDFNLVMYVKNGEEITFTTHGGHKNVSLIPDISTFKPIPWIRDTYRVICEPVDVIDNCIVSSRSVCRSVLQEFHNLGFSLKSAFEYEFIMLNSKGEPLWDTHNVFSSIDNTFMWDFQSSCERNLLMMGVDILTLNVEAAPGQWEWTFKEKFGVQAADDAFTFKNSIKEMTKRYSEVRKSEVKATFMTQPFSVTHGPSSGGHFNHSIWDSKNSELNILWDANASEHQYISRNAKNWIAGLLAHAQAISAFTNPTVNCYKRNFDYSWAPTRINWGFDNRSCLIRVKCKNMNATFFEYRNASSAANPYLVMTSIIAAGMDGIKNSWGDDLMSHISGDGYKSDCGNTLPKSLEESLRYLKDNEVLSKAFGNRFIDRYIETKQCEIEMLNKSLELDNVDIDTAHRLMYIDV